MVGAFSPETLGTVHFDIVDSCQLRCVGCPNSTLLNPVSRISPELFAACLRNIDVREVGTFRFFNYGEPLLHHDLPAIFDVFVREKRFSVAEVELSTNAQFVRWEQLEDVISRGVLNRLVVSCDGDGTPASYERMRPPARWPKLIDFLTRVRQLRDRLAPDLKLVTRTVVGCTEDTVRWSGVLEPLGWTPEFRPWFNLVGGAENLSGRAFEPAAGVCMFMASPQLYVAADGTVVPCCAHPQAGKLGALADTPFSQIYAGQRRADFMAALTHDRSQLDICRTCEFGAGTDMARYSSIADRPAVSLAAGA